MHDSWRYIATAAVRLAWREAYALASSLYGRASLSAAVRTQLDVYLGSGSVWPAGARGRKGRTGWGEAQQER
jgi:hypothetical protein